jgi:hypothetical protein
MEIPEVHELEEQEYAFVAGRIQRLEPPGDGWEGTETIKVAEPNAAVAYMQRGGGLRGSSNNKAAFPSAHIVSYAAALIR